MGKPWEKTRKDGVKLVNVGRKYREHIGKLKGNSGETLEAFVAKCQNPGENLQNTCGNCEHIAGTIMETQGKLTENPWKVWNPAKKDERKALKPPQQIVGSSLKPRTSHSPKEGQNT